jgi:hypothetical protein
MRRVVSAEVGCNGQAGCPDGCTETRAPAADCLGVNDLQVLVDPGALRLASTLDGVERIWSTIVGSLGFYALTSCFSKTHSECINSYDGL